MVVLLFGDGTHRKRYSGVFSVLFYSTVHCFVPVCELVWAAPFSRPTEFVQGPPCWQHTESGGTTTH